MCKIPLIIDIDEIKTFLPGYTPEKADIFHSDSAKIANILFDEAIAKKKNEIIIIMCGGSASGKSEFLAKFLPEDFSGIVFDSTFSTKEGAKIKIRNIQKSKNIPVVYFILPNSLSRSFLAFHKRARKIPEYRFFETHSGSRKVVL